MPRVKFAFSKDQLDAAPARTPTRTPTPTPTRGGDRQRGARAQSVERDSRRGPLHADGPLWHRPRADGDREVSFHETADHAAARRALRRLLAEQARGVLVLAGGGGQPDRGRALRVHLGDPRAGAPRGVQALRGQAARRVHAARRGRRRPGAVGGGRQAQPADAGIRRGRSPRTFRLWACRSDAAASNAASPQSCHDAGHARSHAHAPTPRAVRQRQPAV